MSSKNDVNWYQNHEALKAYILERGHLPDKHVVENRALLSWALCGVQHNGRSITARKSKPVRSRPTRCSSLRSFWHCAATNTPAAASRKTPLIMQRERGNVSSHLQNLYKTCKQVGISFQEYFKKVIQVINSGREDHENLLPMTIKLT